MMPSEWDGFLKGLARQVALDAAFWEVTPMAPEAHAKVVERNIGYFLPVLRAKILPLLEAGARMYENCPIDALAAAWAAAKWAALKGSENAKSGQS